MAEFRFEDLEIWRRAVEIADQLFDEADRLDQNRLYRFAEQLRGAALSVSNNIAEGSGSESNREFKQFLNYARRSAFEVANMAALRVCEPVQVFSALWCLSSSPRKAEPTQGIHSVARKRDIRNSTC